MDSFETRYTYYLGQSSSSFEIFETSLFYFFANFHQFVNFHQSGAEN